ncbi:YALI0B21032p [Yarrowia lipolytica CLIB122]|uniref:YALI0B21032p n=2 Tax=Yarrowia lipolytica TaxID=4952 RepID=Q6CDU9_YARLI|nr:YALI0B21032p [Yarrowia lipolytica CLIB122]AOW02008.1 hypothetical protein YALI1_B27454g [Yarrowia lipolytica]KAB8283401.1 Pre-mRNA splicing factor PRP21 like protein-domain-containing protein [Yarrowia lipolytica]KAE8173366.1 Pre-mRNA splicing factor PRP21 like protein-domain-containing protein [Yarrowia lipolytica]KAJ8052778.1 Pre-mRNA splicing factor PRP21 like protein-domain-containing protein [Yarrowia lipolytica]RMI95705.1 Pre-mRNA splicing factor PRP21 like protein-domain-containing p|eukprot:XP_501163.1 YALI0B21032p [Yarrowia lipolytica CLIB122]
MNPPEGIIIPPPEIKAKIERTAEFVAKNGIAFEHRIREKEGSNALFSFLNNDDHYHLYYQWRCDEYASGRTRETDANTAQLKPKDTSDHLIEPPAFEFHTVLPPMSAVDHEVIHTTAQHTAEYGPSFSMLLAKNEARNPQYEFLKPSHSLHKFYQLLVEQYLKVGQALDAGFSALPESTRTNIEAAVKDKFYALGLAKRRAEWISHTEQKNQRAIEEAERERIAFAEIDWHDFVVAETIVFSDKDKTGELPAPLTLAQLQFSSLEQRSRGLKLEYAPNSDDDDEEENKEIVTKGKMEVKEDAKEEAKEDAKEGSTEVVVKEEPKVYSAPSNMKIRPAGTSKLNKLKNSSPATVVTPSGEVVPESSYDSHMRVYTLDPNWKAQKDLADSRAQSTNLATSGVTHNMKRMAEAKQGDGGRPTKKPVVAWDGRAGSSAAAQEEAMRRAPSKEEQAKQKKERLAKERAIGPGR